MGKVSRSIETFSKLPTEIKVPVCILGAAVLGV